MVLVMSEVELPQEKGARIAQEQGLTDLAQTGYATVTAMLTDVGSGVPESGSSYRKRSNHKLSPSEHIQTIINQMQQAGKLPQEIGEVVDKLLNQPESSKRRKSSSKKKQGLILP